MKVFRRFLKCYARLNAYYRFEFVMQFVRDALMMYCFYALWDALFRQGMGYAGATRIQVILYGVYGAAVSAFVTRDGCQTYIRDRIRQGTMDADLLKPVDLQAHMLMRDAAQKIARFAQFTLPTLVIFQLAMGLFYLPSPRDALLFAVSVLLAYGVLFSINYLFGMLCFYTLSVENISFCYTAVVSFFAGQLVPLWMFPDWAQAVVNVLPFRCIHDIPMSIFIGRFPAGQALRALGLQAAWLAILWACGALAWRRVRAHVVSQGG